MTGAKFWELMSPWQTLQGNREPVEIFKVEMNELSGVLGRELAESSQIHLLVQDGLGEKD